MSKQKSKTETTNEYGYKKGGITITPTSQRISEAVKKAIAERGISYTTFDTYVMHNKVSGPTALRIRNGTSGASLRSVEQVLDALGLKLIVVPKDEDDI